MVAKLLVIVSEHVPRCQSARVWGAVLELAERAPLSHEARVSRAIPTRAGWRGRPFLGQSWEFNNIRPHRSIGMATPAEFAARWRAEYDVKAS